ncbi:MAG TPA: DNA gyrase inhibitor YacG [Steroidobacteraceae bacterium]|nr:DNA gyrase inhibitor YacG [Steroidobacteraceae bacterium]
MGAPIVHCPTCKRAVSWTAESPWRPFCSERCRMVDLGAWFAGERAIPGESVADPEAPLPPDSPRRD